jgi:hypothetical protein
MDQLLEEDQLSARVLLQGQLHQYAGLCMSIILTATAALLQSMFTKEPYHTSIFTGEGWVMELLAGNERCIHCELRVHHEVFAALITDLREMGHGNSKYVSLEEQLIIFLHACITGQTVRHLGKQFQRSNETISQ